MRVMHEAIEDGIGKRGVADEVVPVLDGDLTRDERRASPAPIFDQFEQIAAFAIAQRRQAPVVENQQVGLRKVLQDAAIRAVTAGERELAEQSGQSHISHGVALPTGRMPQRTG